MSRFADPNASSLAPLGACQCPGAPHERDEATIRYELSGSALARIGRAEIEGAVRLDPFAAYRQTVYETVESWNLLWEGPAYDNGKRPIVPVPLTMFAIESLDTATLKVLAETADNLIQHGGVLPNAPGAPSRASRRGSASRTRKLTPIPGT